jgi:L-threonylcarbamoyladenylate synthase
MAPSDGELERAAAALTAGELVCFPTESTYGLAADIASPVALARLVALKGRDARAPIALIAADLDQARSIAAAWPPAASDLAARHWPGPLTLVVPAAAGLPAALVGPAGVGVRVPASPAARRLAALVGRPITATSANRSGAAAAETVDDARAALGDAVAVYLDGGRCAETPSTVVAVALDGSLRLIRAGAVALPGLGPA